MSKHQMQPLELVDDGSVILEAPDLRETSENEGRREIVSFLRNAPQSDAFDIAIALGLGVQFTQALCEQMAHEGILRITPLGLDSKALKAGLLDDKEQEKEP